MAPSGRLALLLALLAAGCGDMSVAGMPVPTDDGSTLTLYTADAAARADCYGQQVGRIAKAYDGGELLPIRARIDASHPRFLAVAEGDRAELRLADGTRLYLPLSGRIAAAVTPDGTHRLLEIPAALALSDCSGKAETR